MYSPLGRAILLKRAPSSRGESTCSRPSRPARRKCPLSPSQPLPDGRRRRLRDGRRASLQSRRLLLGRRGGAPGRLPPDAVAGPVDLVEHHLGDARVVELLELLVELECDARVLDGVVRVDLDALLEEVPGEELEAELAPVVLLVEEVDRVDDLRLGHLDVDHAEVPLEAVPDELAPEVQEHPEPLVRDLEGHQAVPAVAGVEVVGLDARVAVQVVDDRLPDLDPVVYEGQALVLAFAAHDGDTGQCVEVRADDLSNAIRFHLHL